MSQINEKKKYIYVRIKRPEDYEDISDEFVLIDFVATAHMERYPWEYQLIDVLVKIEKP